MRPWAPAGLEDGRLALADPGRDYLVYAPAGGEIALDLAGRDETFTPRWVNPKTGEPAAAGGPVRGGARSTFRAPGPGPAVLWLTRE
jgi:hypothetical protein